MKLQDSTVRLCKTNQIQSGQIFSSLIVNVLYNELLCFKYIKPTGVVIKVIVKRSQIYGFKLLLLIIGGVLR